LSQSERGSASEKRLRRIACLDCGKVANVLSEAGETYFRLEHKGHTVTVEEVGQPAGGNLSPPTAAKQAAKRGSDAPDEAAERRERKASPAQQKEAAGQPAKPAAASVFRSGELMLARSSYIEDSDEAAAEARRVSKVLAEFRWNVTPPYAISMIFADSLCITSDVGPLARELVDRIELLGYSFVAFEASNSRPMAWFKRKRAPPQPEPKVGEHAETTELEGLMSAIRSQSAEIETQREKLEAERRELEERLRLLKGEGAPQNS
jgi:hypothetical protein